MFDAIFLDKLYCHADFGIYYVLAIATYSENMMILYLLAPHEWL